MIDLPVAIVAGASRGLGRVLAQTFLDSGCHVLAVARSLENPHHLSHSHAEGALARLVPASVDLAQPDAGQAVLGACMEAFGRVDYLICNAAVQGPIGAFWEQSLDAWEAAVQINLLAHVRLAHAAIPQMLKNAGPRRGALVFLSGGGATSPRPRFTSYATAKTGLVRFAETLARELQDLGVASNCIAPGVMPTALLDEVLQAGAETAGANEVAAAEKARADGHKVMQRAAACALSLCNGDLPVTGKLVSAPWDQWDGAWCDHITDLAASDVYTLRRIAGRDRGMEWGDV